jgi:thiamine biosynthesis protein ThiS
LAFAADQQELPWKPSQMEIQLNGEPRTIETTWTIADLLNDLKIENRYFAVERNNRVVPREEHSDCRIEPGDTIEVVTLVGGG